MDKYDSKFYSEDNCGGDYLLIKQDKDNVVFLEIGHSCVVMCCHYVPTAFITAALSKAILDYTDIKEAIRGLYYDYSEEFVEGLVSQVESEQERCASTQR